MSELPYKPQTLSIMVVDDHDPIRKAIKRVLQKMNFGNIVECFDGANANEVLVDQPMDLIICDLYMRRMDGFELLTNIRNRDIAADVPVLIVTGEASKDDIVKAVDLGADDYLVKPFQAADLEKKVTAVLTKYFSPAPYLRQIRHGDRLMLQKKWHDAHAAFESALALDPGSVRGKHSKALAMLQLKKQDEAVALLNECTRENSAYFKAFGTLADTYLAMGRTAEAIEFMRREVELNAKNVKRQMDLAKLLLKRDDIDSAMDHFRSALKLNPKLKTALMGMGHALAKQDNLDKAIYYFRRVRRYHPTATKALEAIVQYCEAHQDIHRAELLIKDEKNAHPDRIDAYLILARVQHKQENSGAALETINEALAKSPDNIAAHQEKGLLCLELRDYETSANALERVVKENPSVPAMLALAEAYIGLQKFSEATGLLNKLVLHAPGNHRIWFLQAEVFRRTGQHLKALITYRKAAVSGANPESFQNEANICHGEVKARRRPAGTKSPKTIKKEAS